MSIEQTNIVDFIGVDKITDNVILTISDHLDWDSENEHLLILEEKLNTYLNFIESGQLAETYPNAVNKQVVIKIRSLHEPDKMGLKFLAEVKKIIENAGFLFEFEQSS